MLLTLFLAAALQLPAVQPSENVTAAATLWGECNGLRAQEFARRPDPVETVVLAVEEACRDAAQEVFATIVRDHGEAMAQGAFPTIRERTRARTRQTVLEARGAPRQRGPGNAALAWGECIGQRSTVLAAGDTSADAIADAALVHCADEERALRDWVVRTFGAPNESYVETLRRQARASALRRVEQARAPR